MPLCSVAEQHEIVAKVSALFALAADVEPCAKIGMARAEQLAPAILAKAFRGELVTTEAELALTEGRDYETAGQLVCTCSVVGYEQRTQRKSAAHDEATIVR